MSKYDHCDKYLLWLGGVFDFETMKNNPAVSLAAKRWQDGLIGALNNTGYNVVAIGHMPEPIWPKGKAKIKTELGNFSKAVNGYGIGYWNIPVFRTRCLDAQYLKVFKNVLEQHGHPYCILSYNLYSHSAKVGIYAQDKLGIPWIPILADGALKGGYMKPQMDIHDRLAKKASGRIFLSKAYMDSLNQPPSLHLDGGINKTSFYPYDMNKINENPVILFTGALKKPGGIEFLLESFRLIRNKEVELWICGKGYNAKLKEAIKNDRRIKFWGLVDEDKLEELSLRASFFINPRPNYYKVNFFNYPSKIPEYMSYGKPIISTWTPGLSSDYKDILIVIKKETKECLAKTIEDVISWDKRQYADYCVKVQQFVCSKKLWTIQSQRLINWINEEVLN